MAPHVVWEIVEGQPAQRVEIEHSWGRGEEMATQEQKIVQALWRRCGVYPPDVPTLRQEGRPDLSQRL